MPRAAVAVGCHGHLPVGSGRWVNEASWGQPCWLVGAGACISNSLAHEELTVSQRARLGRRRRLQGSEEGPGREAQQGGDSAAARPRGPRTAMICWPLCGLLDRKGPEHPGSAAGCHAGLRQERLGQPPREQGFLPLLRKTAIWLTPQTRCPAKLEFSHEFCVP